VSALPWFYATQQYGNETVVFRFARRTDRSRWVADAEKPGERNVVKSKEITDADKNNAVVGERY
jgi:hypothetical protein